MRIYRATLTLHEHLYFASRELGILYQTEPLIGNYALAYALGLCQAPYDWNGGPRYRQDLAPLNDRGVYVTPATFSSDTLRFTVTQFNAQSDTYRTIFANNAIVAPGNREYPLKEGQRWAIVNADTGARRRINASNFPQSGKIRMVALGSVATFYLLAADLDMRMPVYIRLGKFNSKARIEWHQSAFEQADGEYATRFLLNAVDLPAGLRLIAFNQISVHPAPLLHDLRAAGPHYRLHGGEALPVGMRFGVDGL